ncbi:MAG: preprotein translocase subunit SecE [Thermoleophilaceae bacterium]|nr:preprotein translocase subunit SecE [Thermoleophilaceae bacterium]
MARNRQKAKQRKAKAEANAGKSGAPANGAADPVGAPPTDEGTVKAAASVDAAEEIKRTAKLKPEPAKSQPKAAKDAKPVKEKGRLRTFLRSSWAELRRVQWPDRKQLTTMTTIVIGFVIIAGAYLGAIDYVANQIVDFIVF